MEDGNAQRVPQHERANEMSTRVRASEYMSDIGGREALRGAANMLPRRQFPVTPGEPPSAVMPASAMPVRRGGERDHGAKPWRDSR